MSKGERAGEEDGGRGRQGPGLCVRSLDLVCYAKHPTHGRDDLIEVLSLLLLCEERTLGAGGEGVKNESRKTS